MTNMLSSFFNPQKGYRKGQKQLDKYYNEGQEALNPYVQHGNEAYGGLSEAMQKLLHPTELQNEWAQSYETSPYAMDEMQANKEYGMQLAQSMGLGGSTPALQAITAESGRIHNADRKNYMDDITNKYFHGANLAQNIYGQGANSANQYANNAMNMGNNSADMAYGAQNAQGDLLGNILGSAAFLGGSYLMGGRNRQGNNGGMQNPGNGGGMLNLWSTMGNGGRKMYPGSRGGY